MLPDISFNREFNKGYNDSFVRQLLSINNTASEEIQQRYATNEKEAIIREKHLSDTISFLQKEGIMAIPLKGLYLLKTIFKDFPGLRTMADIDILVKKENYRKAELLLKSFGDTRSFAENSYCYSRMYHEFVVKYGGSTIEIHRGQSVFDLFKMEYDDFFRAGESVVDNYGVEIFLPPLEMMTLFYLVHDFSDGLDSLQPLSYEKITRMFILFHNGDSEKIETLAKKYDIYHLVQLYDAIFVKVFQNYQCDTKSFPGWFKAVVATGKSESPLRFKYSDTLFKLMVFRGNIIKKVVPRLLCAPVDFLWQAIFTIK